MEARNTSDITRVVQTLFEENSEMYPIRDQGGAYFIPKEKLDFVYKVADFLDKLGGQLRRFEIVDSDYARESVKDSMAEAIIKAVEDHEAAIESFTINTRADTMNAAAERIKETRHKVEGYAYLLRDRSDELIKKIDKANKKLSAQIENLAEERENAPQSVGQVFGFAPTKIIRWMGIQNWTWQEAKHVLTSFGVMVQDTTVKGQMWVGAAGRDKPAELNDKQVADLEKRRKVAQKELSK
jgi:hypothetical protein